tara:strand:- start:647 stop:817 length:171 start_codon:yes stop_codon:yes gene_type:complete
MTFRKLVQKLKLGKILKGGRKKTHKRTRVKKYKKTTRQLTKKNKTRYKKNKVGGKG